MTRIMACRNSSSSHYLNQWWLFANCNSGNKFQWNSNRSTNILIQQKAFGHSVSKIVTWRGATQEVSTLAIPEYSGFSSRMANTLCLHRVGGILPLPEPVLTKISEHNSPINHDPKRTYHKKREHVTETSPHWEIFLHLSKVAYEALN